MKSLLHCCKPDSVGTSVRIVTQWSVQESIFAMPKIPKKKGKAADGGSTNVNWGVRIAVMVVLVVAVMGL